MKYKVFPDRIKLRDSYLIPKANFRRELVSIKNLHPDCPIWGRSFISLRREWALHNLVYSLGISREKTKDCDLNFKNKWYMNFAYWVVGRIALWVIK